MISNESNAQGIQGRLQPDFDTLDQALDSVETFLRNHLSGWLKDSARQKASLSSERDLAADLCNFLETMSRENETVFKFDHEWPEGKRSLDVGVTPARSSGIWVSDQCLSRRDCFYAIEAKRLPTPEKSTRQREYVIGDEKDWDLPDKKTSGGIERFKECKHGNGLGRSAIIAFVQGHEQSPWQVMVNGWIQEAIVRPLPSHGATWNENEFLTEASLERDGVSEFTSQHGRSDGSTIRLCHLWINLIGSN